MGKDQFVDSKLVNIRGKLMEEARESSVGVVNSANHVESPSGEGRRMPTSSSSVSINDKEWKKAIFQRWDEFKALRRDVLLKLNSTLSVIPEDIALSERRIVELRSAELKIKDLLSSIEVLDDSSWDRYSLSTELAYAMKKVENARLELMIITGKLADKDSLGVQNSPQSSTSFIHEIQSLSFGQAFRLGLGFSFSLIIGLILSVLLLSLFNYLTLM